MDNNKLDVIIVNFNSSDYTIRCIRSVQAASGVLFKLRIIVVDNASVDNPERIKQTYPDIDLVLNKSNVGFSKAVNIALKRAKGEIMVLLNPDTVICEGLLSKAVNYILEHEDIAVVGPKVLDFAGTIQGSARRFPTVLTSLFGRKSPLTRLFPNNPITKREFLCFNGHGGKPIDVDWVSGACMVIRKKALDEVGGFDERYFMYWEDTDLCKELKNKGWRIVYLPEADIYHHIGVSSGSKPIASIINFHRSCYLLCKKHAKGLKRAFIPLAFCGLSIRCLMVLALNRYQFLISRLKADSVKSKTHNFNNKQHTEIKPDLNSNRNFRPELITEPTAFTVPIVDFKISRIKKAKDTAADDEREQVKKGYNYPRIDHSDKQLIRRA